MGASNKAVKIGVIAEERNDVEVLYQLTCKLVKESAFSFSPFIGHGCGKLRRKCGAWAVNLVQRGCAHLVVMHDLDRHDESELRVFLENAIQNVAVKSSIVLIPIEELEAWLLSDPDAIKVAFNMRSTPRIPARPEALQSPKEFLSAIVARHSKAQYLNTVHNARIAAQMSITSLDRCPSFSRYPPFVAKAIGGK